MTFKYNIVTTDSTQAVAVFVDGELLQATSDHPNWDKIIEAVKAGDERVAGLFEFGKAVVKGFQRFSERVTYSGGTLFFDNDPVDNSLAKRVVKFYNEDLDYGPLVAFFEKVSQNPEEHSREQLYRWLEAHDFAITDDGDIVAYKGVSTGVNAQFQSQNSGTAIVNGEVQNGRIQQNFGDVVEMPRSEVQHDPSRGCHTGLHVGNWSYASTFADQTILVLVNPRDVVSVPTDSYDQKMRVCRYMVLQQVTDPWPSALYRLNDDSTFDYDDGLEEYDYDDSDEYDPGYGEEVPVLSPAAPLWYPSVTDSTGPVATNYQPRHAARRPTDDNHKSQPRDAQGHFIKKNK